MNAQDREYFNVLMSDIKTDIADIKSDMKAYALKVTELEKREIGHSTMCPQNTALRDAIKDIGVVKEELMEYRFFRKYPKAAAILFLFFLLSVVGSSVVIYGKAKKEVQKIEILTNGVNNI